MERLRLRCPDYPNCSECPERSRIGNIETVQDLRLGAPSPTDTASSFSPFYYDHEHFQAAFPAVEEQPPQSKLGSLHDVALKVFCGGTESDEPPDAKDVNQRINAGHFETDSLESTSVRSNKAICNRPYISQISDFRACGNPEDSERLDTRDHFPHLEQKREDLEDTKAHGGMGGGDEAEDRKKDSYPRTLPLTLIIIGLCLSVFLISLDRTIITTVRVQSQLTCHYLQAWRQFPLLPVNSTRQKTLGGMGPRTCSRHLPSSHYMGVSSPSSI